MRVVALLMLVGMLSAHARGATLRLRDCRAIEDRSVEGLSGITFAGEGRYYAVADNTDRFYPIAIDVNSDATIAAMKLHKPWRLPRRGDYEGVALSGSRDSVWISDESPAVTEHLLPQMRVLRALPVPELLRAIEPNQGFESLTVSPDGKTLWTGNERALAIDGNPRTPATPFLSVTRVRLVRYDLSMPEGAAPVAQYEYQTGGVHGAGGQIGMCDLAALPDGRLLALERSAAKGLSGNKSIRTRIYLVDVSGATDISQPPYDAGLIDRAPVKASKTLLYDGFVCDADGENLEGLCLGPPLGPGRWAVIGVVDSTDGGVGVSRSMVVSFELDLSAPATRPASRAATPTTDPAQVNEQSR